MVGEPEGADRLAHALALRDAGREQHDRRAVVGDLHPHAERPERLAHALLLRAPRPHDDAARLEGDPLGVQLGEQPARRRRRVVAEDADRREVQDAAVLGDDRVEEVDGLADAQQLEEGPPGDQDQA